MERRWPASDQARSRRDLNLTLERPVTLPLEQGNRHDGQEEQYIKIHKKLHIHCNWM